MFSLKMDPSMKRWYVFVCVLWVRGLDGGYIYPLIGTASHNRVTWILSVRVSLHNPDFSELVRSINVQKWQNNS